ncbi:MAG TPA: peptidylprolyl isomerase [Acidobacteriota bacterium]|nr:peptidylprolyl isomerase [Acidobacteriota bacterium]
MIRIDIRRHAPRTTGHAAASLLLALALVLAPATALADDPPAEKAEEAKEHAEEAKAAGQEKAAEAKEKSAKKAKSKEKAKKASAKQEAAKASAKGETVSQDAKAAAGTMPVKPDVEPQHVQVQHILIAFAGSGTRATRSKDEAKKLAYEILERARKGEDFDALVRQHTDDSPPGIYGMSGIGVPPAPGEYARNGMVPAFGNVGFAISPGNIGMADWDAQASPYGWHIIKRLK